MFEGPWVRLALPFTVAPEATPIPPTIQPPYRPDANRIERICPDLHANVTRNHRCKTMKTLLGKARAYLEAYVCRRVTGAARFSVGWHDVVPDHGRSSSVTELTMNMCLRRSQFLRCGDDKNGLVERDLPGGTEALAEAIEHVAALLEHRRRGLGAAQLRAEVTRLSQMHA